MNIDLFLLLVQKIWGLMRIAFAVLLMPRVPGEQRYLSRRILQNATGMMPELVIRVLKNEVLSEEED